MSTNPCQICGCTDLNLVDGFYYCVECGTQDVNIRETVVEKTIIADYGASMVTDVKKFTTVLKDAVQMSGEWCKWHSYNFILSSLADELLSLGAKPTVKLKVLWIWVRYIKKFQKKDEPEATIFENKSIEDDNEEVEELNSHDIDNLLDKTKCEEENNLKKDKFRVDINNVTSAMLLAILYIALNLDRSDIQLNHLFQYIREGRLSVFNCLKFVPKELSFKSTPNYTHFENSTRYSYQGGCSPLRIRQVAMTLFKRLDLGVPLVPDLNKIINCYITELCLPNDFKHLVLSLTSLLPSKCLEMDASTMKYAVRTPDYEAYCMSYVLLAIKMCFGLDGDYEIKLSDAVEKINREEDYLKCYKLNMYSEPTDRLFSFRDWCKFLLFRKITLSKHYLPMANQLKLPADDHVFMEHTDKRKTQHMMLSYDVAMDILNKIPSDDKRVLPKKQFPVTLTPMTIYTDIIKECIYEPDIKLFLSEDFSQYSLKYATRDLKLPGCNMMNKGVDKRNKIINPRLLVCASAAPSVRKLGDTGIVLIRNCDNKNWLKTKPPKIKHITKTSKSNSRFDSSSELTSESESEFESEDENHDSDGETYDEIIEEDEELSIFDDDFKNLQIEEGGKTDASHIEHVYEFHNNNINENKTVLLDNNTVQDTFSEISEPEMVFDPETFDKEKVIKELIVIACKKFKIPVPKEKEDRMPVKRKNIEQIDAGVSEPKRKKQDNRMKPGEAAKLKLEIMNAYYENLNNDLFVQLSKQVKSVVDTIENQAECNIADDILNKTGEIQDEFTNGSEILHDTANLRDNTETLNNDDNASIHGNNIEDTANDSIDENDDNKEYDIEELLPKVEPKFDPQTHDIKQLYLNINNEFVDLFSNIENDPDINDMIDKKIAEFHDVNENEKELLENETKIDMIENQLLSNNDTDINDNIDANDSDDEPLSKLLERKILYQKKKDTSNLEYLIPNRNKRKFQYWMKHYKWKSRSRDLNQTFHIELNENYPKSFIFIINECAAISNSSPFNLYMKLNCLEDKILEFL